uniref:DNA-directed DNA polymerase n=1 Tax=Thermogladius calderae TaxID=1200300 RepID=A0A7J3Y0G3_9CREN
MSMGEYSRVGESWPATWLLDARPSPSRGVVLELYEEATGRVREIESDILYYGYIYSDNPHAVSRQLVYEGLVEDAWVEEWFTPPYYREKKSIVVFTAKSFRELKRILATGEKNCLEPLNKYPHPLVEALYRAGLRPLTRVIELKERGVSTTWSYSGRDPILRSLVISAGNGSYIVEGGRRLRTWSIREVASAIVEYRPLIVFTEPGLYLRLVSEEPAVRESVWKWVLGGSFSAHEYYEWSRLSYTPLSLMNNVTIGRVLTTIEALESRKMKYVIQREHSRPEKFRSLVDLIALDRGGVVFKPRPGLYWNVCQIDFKSLYPSIISRLNISGETVNDPYCKSKMSLDYAGKDVCLERRGVVPSSLEKLLYLKDLYDRLYKKTGDELYNARKSAVKWLLVASFGYLGYRNSLFGSISAHEAVTATSREIMRKASERVGEEGLRVVHIIVDSLFVSGVPSEGCCGKLAELISGVTGYETKVESYYIWLYIPRENGSRRGVANRYYGLLSNGGLKIKGVLAARRDTPELVKAAEIEALSKLAEAREPGSFTGALLKAYKVVEDYKLGLTRGLDPRLLVMTRYRNVRGGYRKPPKYVVEGEGPPYMLIASKNGLKPYRENTELEINLDYYLEMLDKVRRELPEPGDVDAPASQNPTGSYRELACPP